MENNTKTTKSLIVAFDISNNYLVGVYPTLDETEFEVMANALDKKYDIRNIMIKVVDNIEEKEYVCV